MNWDAIGAVGEIVGAAGVIISLGFLAFETRRNTESLRASLSHDTLKSVAELNDLIVENPELRRVASKIQNPAVSVDDLDTDELDIALYIARALFMRFEGIYLLYKRGLVEEELWLQRQAAGAGMLQLPILKRYWEDEMNNSVYTPSFIQVMNSAVGANLKAPMSADRKRP
jgi:hypothetical protein